MKSSNKMLSEIELKKCHTIMGSIKKAFINNKKDPKKEFERGVS